MHVITSETCWALNNEIKSKWPQVDLSLFNYQDDGRSNKHKTSLAGVVEMVGSDVPVQENEPADYKKDKRILD